MIGLHERLLEEISNLSQEEKIDLFLFLEGRGTYNNRRKDMRYPFFTEISYTDKQSKIYQEFVRDISSAGMFIETSNPLPEGETLYVRLSVPGLEEEIRVPVKVVRTQPEGMAVHFKQQLPAIKRLLRPMSRFGLSRALGIARAKAALKSRLPNPVLQKFGQQKKRLHYVLAPLNKLRYRGSKRYCPVCKSPITRFQPLYDHNPPRPEARCPVCQSLERHRLDWLFFQEMTDLFDLKAKLLLHIAPKNIFERRFQQQAALTSITLDLKQKDVNTRADIAKLPFARNTFDVIYCSHVLEHVPDDLVAISELHRVLKPGGWAVLQVPITAKKTLEDPSISDPILCTKLFGQHDHVRRYGLDFKDRLEAMHFQASVYTAEEIVREKHQLVRMGIQVYRKVFYCLKS